MSGNVDRKEYKPWASLEYSSNLPGFFKWLTLGKNLLYQGNMGAIGAGSEGRIGFERRSGSEARGA
jgi:hypothetical protein